MGSKRAGIGDKAAPRRSIPLLENQCESAFVIRRSLLHGKSLVLDELGQGADDAVEGGVAGKLLARTSPFQGRWPEVPFAINSEGNAAKCAGEAAEIARQFFAKLEEEPQSSIAECLRRQDSACGTVARASDQLERCSKEIQLRRTKPSACDEDGTQRECADFRPQLWLVSSSDTENGAMGPRAYWLP